MTTRRWATRLGTLRSAALRRGGCLGSATDRRAPYLLRPSRLDVRDSREENMDLVLTRRGLLRRGSGLFLLGASGIFLGAACSSAPTAGGSSAGTAASKSTGAASSRVVLPRRIPLAGLPQPDLPPSA